jgi:CrcB protein
VARFLVARSLPVPYGTLAVNVTGAFVLGLLGNNFVLGTGFVGAYTTFSTWMFESHALSRRAALANILASLALGLAAAQLGIELRDAG